MDKRIYAGVVLAGAAFLLVGFQNCSGGDLPDTATSYQQLQSIAPLSLQVPTTAMGPGSTMSLTASGGVPPYKYVVLSGPVTVAQATGLITSAQSGGAVAVRVTDSTSNSADGSFTVDLSLAPVISGVLELAAASTAPQTFAVQAFNTLTIEAWGGGGGGGGYANLTGGDGMDGGVTSIVGAGVNLTADGGKKGAKCANNQYNGPGGAGGAVPTSNGINTAGKKADNPVVIVSPLTLTPSKGGDGANGGAGGTVAHNGLYVGSPGAAPGGGGGGSGYYSDSVSGVCLSGGGGGGSYFKATYNRGALAVGTSLTLSVGAGGAITYTNSLGATAGAGAPGKIKIIWN